MAKLLQTLLEPCAAKIEIEENERAKRVALREYSMGDQSQRLVIWSDGSHRINGSGFAIVWCNDIVIDDWDSRVFKLDLSFNNHFAEFFAFSEATKLALETSEEDARISRIVVYTDSQYSLQIIRDFHGKTPVQRFKFSRQLELAEIKTRVNTLRSMGIDVVFRWVPGHSSIPGNVRADQLAGQASGAPSNSLIPLYRPPSNGYLEPRPKKKEKKEARRSIRHGRIQKKESNPNRTPLGRYYAARMQGGLLNINRGLRNTILDTLEAYIDHQIAENASR